MGSSNDVYLALKGDGRGGFGHEDDDNSEMPRTDSEARRDTN